MKAKRQNRTLSVSATMLDGSRGHVTWEQYPRMLYVSQLANSAIPSRHENEVFDRSGTARLIDWYNTILYDKAGHPAGVASIGHEITIDVALQTLSQEEREALSR